MNDDLLQRWHDAVNAPPVAAAGEIEELLARHFLYVESALRDAHARGDTYAPDPGRRARLVLDCIDGATTRARILNDLAPVRELEASLFEILQAPVPAGAER